MPDISSIILEDVKYNLKDADARFIIMSYGHSTWSDFITAYQKNTLVYCRASSNSNPASGSQTRLAFMAYVNNADNPTNVEFQYYRSVNAHSATQQGDQVYVYKLDKNAGWTVTVREAYSKIVAGTGMSSSYASGTITLTASGEVNQNAFSNVAVGSTTIAADTTTDTITLVAGDNITLTPDAANDSVTITNDIVVDSSMSSSSTNPVQNNVIKNYVDNKIKINLVNQSIGTEWDSYTHLYDGFANHYWMQLQGMYWDPNSESVIITVIPSPIRAQVGEDEYNDYVKEWSSCSIRCLSAEIISGNTRLTFGADTVPQFAIPVNIEFFITAN